MIERIFFTEDSTYIDDKNGCTIRTDNLTVQQAMQLAFDTKSQFEFDNENEWFIRQGIHAFGKITNTQTLFDVYNNLSLHILNNNIIEDFQVDMSHGFTELFQTMLTTEYEHGYQMDTITDELIECYMRSFIADQLDSYIAQNPKNEWAKKYYDIFQNYESYSIHDIQHQIFIDNEKIHNSKAIRWIDIHYHEKQQEMVLLGYNEMGEEAFRTTIKNIPQDQAEKTYTTFCNGMEADIFIQH